MTGKPDQPSPGCPESDRILAVFLDGEAENARAGLDLAAHLDSCPPCQQALRGARRLDALLAQSASSEVPEPLAERLLASAAAPSPELAAGPSRRPPLLLLLLLFGLGLTASICLGILFGLRLTSKQPQPGPQPGPQPQPQSQVARPMLPQGSPSELEQQPTPVEEPLDPDFLPLPDLPSRRRRAASRRLGDRQPLAWSLLQEPRLEQRLLPLLGLRGLLASLQQVVGIAAAAPDLSPWAHAQRMARDLRRESFRMLLACRSYQERRRLVDFLARTADGPELGWMLAQARRDQDFIAYLRRKLRQEKLHSRPRGPFFTAAVRLGDPGLDRFLLEACRGLPVAATALAGASAESVSRPGRTLLLLDLWSTLRVRGQEPDGEKLAQAWFASLPASTTAELVDLARRTNRAGRRQQCLLALGALRDPRATAYLLGLVEGPRLEEARLAGHALSRLLGQDADAEILEALRQSRRPALLCAALAGMHSPYSAATLRQLDLSHDERAFLEAGNFSVKQYAIACQLYRGRRTQTN